MDLDRRAKAMEFPEARVGPIFVILEQVDILNRVRENTNDMRWYDIDPIKQ